MHIWSLANIYIGHTYMFAMFICWFFVHFACCICENECKLTQMYAQLHINASPNEESGPQICAAKLTLIHGTKVDQASYQWLD